MLMLMVDGFRFRGVFVFAVFTRFSFSLFAVFYMVFCHIPVML
jgi:hypothetical protein